MEDSDQQILRWIDAGSQSPTWSPDGETIAFTSNVYDDTGISRQVLMITVDGSQLAQVTHGQRDYWTPDWSPDGSKLVFASDEVGSWEIYVINLEP